MINIAVVDDEPKELDQICIYAKKYEDISSNKLSVHTFTDGDELLEEFIPGGFDILLLDIQMKRIDGITTAKKIRTLDENVVIIFITNIVQYAVQGYSVHALDFIVKPIDYTAFSNKIDLAIQHVHKQAATTVWIKMLSGLVLVKLDEIICVEIISRKLFIHTLGKSYQCNETLQGIEEKINDGRFYRCHAAYLVNLQHVHQIGKSTAIIAKRQVPISRHRYKGFVDALTKFLGGHV